LIFAKASALFPVGKQFLASSLETEPGFTEN